MSSLMAWMGNCNRSPDSEPFQPRDFDPFAEPEPNLPLTFFRELLPMGKKTDQAK